MIIEKFNELGSLISYLKNGEKELILKALEFSDKAHKNQLRKSGEPFILHPIEVAKILTTIKLDADSIVAGLLHDTVEDTALTVSNIKENFGNQIAELVDGLTKISKYSLKVNKQKLGENYRKLLLAATMDLRVILIKLADRLHNMRTLKFIKNEDKKTNTAL